MYYDFENINFFFFFARVHFFLTVFRETQTVPGARIQCRRCTVINVRVARDRKEKSLHDNIADKK